MKTSLTLAAILAATTFAFTSATTLTIPEKSQAAGCSYLSCDWQDPVLMGCTDGITVYGPVSVTLDSGMTVEMRARWSRSCQANWLKFTRSDAWFTSDAETVAYAVLDSGDTRVSSNSTFGTFEPRVATSLMIGATASDRICASSSAYGLRTARKWFPHFCV